MLRDILLLLSLISIVLGQDSRQDKYPPLPAPIGCKSVDHFDECVRPAASALLCNEDDIPCICSGYRIERGCYTSYCPGNSWEYEDRGTTCDSTKTAAAQASVTSAGTPSHASATPTKGPKVKGNTQSSAASEAGAAASATSSQISAGGHSVTITMSGLLVIAAVALRTLNLR